MAARFMDNESLVFYTDGSKRESLDGAGTFCEDPEVRIPTSFEIHASVFQAEILAMITAADYIA